MDDTIWTPCLVAMPAPETWCFAWNGSEVVIVLHDPMAVHGWSNADTWEDWEGDISYWMPIAWPEPPGEG